MRVFYQFWDAPRDTSALFNLMPFDLMQEQQEAIFKIINFLASKQKDAIFQIVRNSQKKKLNCEKN